LSKQKNKKDVKIKMPMPEKEDSLWLSVKLDLELKNALRKKAKAKRLNLSQYVTEILLDSISNDQKELLEKLAFLKSLFEEDKIKVYRNKMTSQEVEKLGQI